MLFFEEKMIKRTKKIAHIGKECAGLLAEETDFNIQKVGFTVFLQLRESDCRRDWDVKDMVLHGNMIVTVLQRRLYLVVTDVVLYGKTVLNGE